MPSSSPRLEAGDLGTAIGVALRHDLKPGQHAVKDDVAVTIQRRRDGDHLIACKIDEDKRPVTKFTKSYRLSRFHAKVVADTDGRPSTASALP